MSNPENYIEELRKRLAQHEGCSRFGPSDSLLLRPFAEIHAAIKEAKAALVGDSNDAEHDALVAVMRAIGYDIPECRDDDLCACWPHHKDCPCHEWEAK